MLITFFLTDWQHVIEQQRLITSKQVPKFRRKSAFFPQNRMALTYEPDRENPGDSGDEIVSVSTEAGIGKHLDRNSTAPAHDLNRVRQALRKLKGLLRACQPLAIYLPTPCQPLANPLPKACQNQCRSLANMRNLRLGDPVWHRDVQPWRAVARKRPAYPIRTREDKPRLILKKQVLQKANMRNSSEKNGVVTNVIQTFFQPLKIIPQNLYICGLKNIRLRKL